MKLLRHLPNALTCGNLLCGTFGIISITKGHATTTDAYAFVVAACIFDFLDGFAARMLNVSSPLGKQLDSLADMVSFGVFPTVVTFVIFYSHQDVPHIYLLSSLMLALFSALRLAKFNIDERQSDAFIGLPTPAGALFMTGLPLLPGPLASWATSPPVLAVLVIAASFMLVAPLDLFALKFKNFTWADNKIRFTFLFLAVLLFAIWGIGALSPVILLYIAISLVSRVLKVS